jgi:hypothetical protein
VYVELEAETVPNVKTEVYEFGIGSGLPQFGAADALGVGLGVGDGLGVVEGDGVGDGLGPVLGVPVGVIGTQPVDVWTPAKT